MLVRTIQIDDLLRSNLFVKSLSRVPQLPRRYFEQFLPFKFLNERWTEKAATPPVNYAQYFSYNIHFSIFHLKPFENLFLPFFELKNAPRNTSTVVDGFPLRINT